MEEFAAKIQMVINTLGELKMETTFDNVNRMLGIYVALREVRDGLKVIGEELKDGNTDTE